MTKGLFTWRWGTPGRWGNRLAVVEKWPAFTYKLTTPESWGDVTRRCCVVVRHVNRENGGRTMHFGGQCSFPLFICSRYNISVLSLLMNLARLQNVTWTRPQLGGLSHFESFTWQNATPAERVTDLADRATRLGGLPHLSYKHDQIKMRDYMERRVTPPRQVTSPTWGPPPSCKQALINLFSSVCLYTLINIGFYPDAFLKMCSHCSSSKNLWSSKFSPIFSTYNMNLHYSVNYKEWTRLHIQ